MAWYERDPRSGIYRVRFRFPTDCPAKHRVPKEYKIRDRDAAEALCVQIDETIGLIERGLIKIPPGVDPVAFISSGGRLTETPTAAAPAKPLTLGDLFDGYLREMAQVEDRGSTLRTERIHIAHLSEAELLGSARPVDAITFDDIQNYATARSRRRYRGRPIQPPTIEKELETLGTIWRWGLRKGLVRGPVPWRLKDLTMPLAEEKERFRTYEEIARKVGRGGLTPGQEAALWDCLYLKGDHVREILDLVEARPAEPFVYPMFAFVAMTGARRSELLRSQVDDFHLDEGSVTIRGTKGRTKTREVKRLVDLHPRLRAAMTDWFSRHPGGQHTLCQADGSPLTRDAADHHFRRALKGTRWEVIKGFHTFRHSVASILASSGEDQRYIDKYLGHQTEEMKKRYQHLFPKGSRRPIEALFE